MGTDRHIDDFSEYEKEFDKLIIEQEKLEIKLKKAEKQNRVLEAELAVKDSELKKCLSELSEANGEVEELENSAQSIFSREFLRNITNAHHIDPSQHYRNPELMPRMQTRIYELEQELERLNHLNVRLAPTVLPNASPRTDHHMHPMGHSTMHVTQSMYYGANRDPSSYGYSHALILDQMDGSPHIKINRVTDDINSRGRDQRDTLLEVEHMLDGMYRELKIATLEKAFRTKIERPDKTPYRHRNQDLTW